MIADPSQYIEEEDGNPISTVLLVNCPTGYVKNATGICVESCNPDKLALFDTESVGGECTSCGQGEYIDQTEHKCVKLPDKIIGAFLADLC